MPAENTYLLFYNTYPLLAAIEHIPPILQHIPLFPVVEHIPAILQHIPLLHNIASKRTMYLISQHPILTLITPHRTRTPIYNTPLFPVVEHILPILQHIPPIAQHMPLKNYFTALTLITPHT